MTPNPVTDFVGPCIVADLVGLGLLLLAVAALDWLRPPKPPRPSPEEAARLRTQVKADLQRRWDRARIIAQPHTREDVLAAAARDFPREDPASIMAILDLYGTEPAHRERERVQMDILVVSGGDMNKLLQYVDLARMDYRDVIVMAEYAGRKRPRDPQAEEIARMHTLRLALLLAGMALVAVLLLLLWLRQGL
jgi:hypothetical protein